MQMTTEDKVRHYQRSIDRSILDKPRLLHCIKALSKLPVTIELLTVTGVGRTVNSLRKIEDGVGDAAKALVARWKDIVSNAPDSPGHDEEAQEEEHVDEQETYESEMGYEDESYSSPPEDTAKRKSVNGFDAPDALKKSPPAMIIDMDTLPDSSGLVDENDVYENENSEEEPEPESPDHSSKHSSSSHKKDSHKSSNKHSSSKDRHESSKSSKSSKDSSSSEHKKKEKSKSRSSSSSSKDKDRKHSESKKRKAELNSYGEESKKKRIKSTSEEENESNDEMEQDDFVIDDNEAESSGSDQSEDESYSKNKESSLKNESHSDKTKDKHRSSSHSSHSKTKNHEASDKSKKDGKHSKSDERKKEEKNKSDEHRSKESSKSKSSSSSSSKDSKDKDSSKERSKRKDSESSSKSQDDKGKSKHKSHKEKKEKKKSKKNSDEDEGIGWSSGTSFADALGMCTMPPPTKKKKESSSSTSKPVKVEEPSSSSTPSSSSSKSSSSGIKSSSKSSSSSSSSSSSKVKTESKPRPPSPESPEDLPLLSSSIKLEPLSKIDEEVNLAATLPEISPNYKPLPQIMTSAQRKFEEDEMLAQVIYAKNARTKVYSGNKVAGYTVIPSLQELCVRLLIDNIDAMEYTGGVPYYILKPVLERATSDQLFTLETYNPYLMEESDTLWQFHCGKDFRTKKREEMESWRDMYLRCMDEREAKLKALTANIKSAIDKSTPVRSTKLAYVDHIVKPPRNVLRQQARFGTANVSSKTDLKKKLITGMAGSSGASGSGQERISVPPPPQARPRATISAPLKKPKAPLMMKALQAIKGRYKR